MGTSTITCNTPKDRIDYINEKDAKTTSVKLGFRVTGFVLKNKEGEVVERVIKQHGRY